MTDNTWVAHGTWVGIVAILWILALVVAESIPVFNDLLSLISAIFGSWFSYIMSSVFFFWLNWGNCWSGGLRKRVLTVVNVVIFVMGVAIFGMGVYSTGTQLASAGGHSWSCVDNSPKA